jgi:acetolactate synthase regulatory subunit
MFGSTRLADVCAAVEVEPQSAAGRLEAMTVESDRAVAALRAHLAELG